VFATDFSHLELSQDIGRLLNGQPTKEMQQKLDDKAEMRRAQNRLKEERGKAEERKKAEDKKKAQDRKKAQDDERKERRLKALERKRQKQLEDKKTPPKKDDKKTPLSPDERDEKKPVWGAGRCGARMSRLTREPCRRRTTRRLHPRRTTRRRPCRPTSVTRRCRCVGPAVAVHECLG
jgi:hypothetical protein